MQTKTNSGARSAFKKAVLPAIAMATLLAGLTAAKAWDQQATGAEMDYELSQRAAGASPSAYDQAPLYRHRTRQERVRD